VRVLIAHNRYRSEQPSGENVVVDDEARLLAEHGCEVELLQTHSDEIADGPRTRGVASRAHRVVPGRAAARCRRDRTFPPRRRARAQTPSRCSARRRCVRHALWRGCGGDDAQLPAAVLGGDVRARRQGLHVVPGRRPSAGPRHGLLPELAPRDLAARSDDLHPPARGTWRNSVDRYVFPSAFARSLYVQAGWAPERLVVKPNTAPEPGLTRNGSGRGFVALSRFSDEKGLDTLLDRLARRGPRRAADKIGSGELDGSSAPARSGWPTSSSRGGCRTVTRSRASPERAHWSCRRAGSRCSRAQSSRHTRSGCPWSRRARFTRRHRRGRRDGLQFEPDSPAGLVEALRTLATQTR